MSVNASIKLVDWNRLESAVENGRHIEEFIEALEKDEPWVESYRIPDILKRWSVATDASDAYDFVRLHLESTFQDRLDRFIQSTFAGWPHEPLNDLHLKRVNDQESEVFAITADPQTARDFADLWKIIMVDLDDLEKPFGHYLAEEKPQGRIRTFQDFKDYLAAWGGVFVRAVSENRGVVVTIA